MQDTPHRFTMPRVGQKVDRLVDFMTFQVGLVGSDGVLLASDRRHTRQDTCRSSFQSDKIFLSSRQRLAYCAAGDDIAEAVGVKLLEFEDASASDAAYKEQLELRSGSAVE